MAVNENNEVVIRTVDAITTGKVAGTVGTPASEQRIHAASLAVEMNVANVGVVRQLHSALHERYRFQETEAAAAIQNKIAAIHASSVKRQEEAATKEADATRKREKVANINAVASFVLAFVVAVATIVQAWVAFQTLRQPASVPAPSPAGANAPAKASK
jgi:hypothetical protein